MRLLLLLPLLVACDPPARRALLLGERLLQEGRPLEAVEPLKESIDRFGTNTVAAARAWNYLGIAYHVAGRPADAEQAYRIALTRDFNLFAARYNRGCLLLEQTNVNGAVNELTTYTAHQAQDPRGWYQLGRAQMRARLYEAAEHSFRRVLELDPRAEFAAETLNALGMSHALRHRTADAFRQFNAALKQATNYPPALLNQAIVAHQQLGDRQLALQKYRAYLDVVGRGTNQTPVLALVSQLEADLQPRPAPTNAPPPGVPAQHPATRMGPTNSPPGVPVIQPGLTRTQAPPGRALTNAHPPSPVPATNALTTKTSVVAAAQSLTRPPLLTALSTNRTSSPSAPREAARDSTNRPDTASRSGAASPATTHRPPATREPTLAAQTRAPILTPTPSALIPAITNATPQIPPPLPTSITTNPPAPATHSPTPTPPTRTNPPAPLELVRLETELSPPPARDVVLPRRPTTPPPTSATSPPPSRITRESVAITNVTPDGLTHAATSSPSSFPRYAYRHPGTPPTGDRAQAEQLLTTGFQAQEDGDLSRAEQSYRSAIAADPSLFAAHYNFGVTAYDAGRWQESAVAFEQALALKPGDANTRLNLALALERGGCVLDAAQELEALLKTQSSNADAHLMLANLYAEKIGDRSRARTHYKRVLQLVPRHPQAAHIRRWLAQ